MDKLQPLSIDGLTEVDEIIEKCNLVFKEDLQHRENRPKIHDTEIFLSLGSWIENKAEFFWHLSSLESGRYKSAEYPPCTNDGISDICDGNCCYPRKIITLPQRKEERDICIFRAVRIGWIKKIILLFNENDSRVRFWESEDNRYFYLRYLEEEIDYILVFEFRRKKGKEILALVTSYPVFRRRTKQDFNAAYELYKIRNQNEESDEGCSINAKKIR